MYGYRLTEMFEAINEEFESLPWKWELMCCCRAELCNTPMAVIQMGEVDTCYHYDGFLHNTSLRAMERQRCPSAYCKGYIYTTSLTGSDNFLIATSCADKDTCDNLKGGCAFLGDEYVTAMARNLSATLTEEAGEEKAAKLYSLCCCQGDRCNDKEALWKSHAEKFGLIPDPSAASSEPAHDCLEYNVIPDDGSNITRLIGMEKCVNASGYCLSQERLTTTLAFGKSRRRLVGGCAEDEDEVELCKQINNATYANGTRNGRSCFYSDESVKSELSKKFLVSFVSILGILM